jgi:glyoxylase-like metal-dependent hydrolase (beta-lactamase superfamily II)
MSDRLYFRQLLSGRDFATDDMVARQMVNFVYLVGDRETGEAVAVDPAYRVGDLVDLLAADGMRLTGALATHYHADHVGGSFGGHTVEGIRELLETAPGPIHVQRDEAEWVRKSTGVSGAELVVHEGGDVLRVGDVEVQLLHTPGHTPGSQCFLVDGMLVSGDTLFLEGCGRTDLPGADVEAMYDSLQKLASLPDDTAVYPGHRYSAPSVGSMAAIRETNYVYKQTTREQWLAMFAGQF